MGVMSTTHGTQSTGGAEEEDVTICQGTSEEGGEEGVGEWKAGIAERAGQGCWWLWFRKRSRSRCQTSYSYSPLVLSPSLRVPLVIVFAIEGLDACIRSPKTRVLWRSSFI
jgi:hypothetical protein